MEVRFCSLALLYSEQHRRYHTLNHIHDCLDKLRLNFKEHLSQHDFEVITLALIYHDVIYNPKAIDNEELSAQYFKEDAKSLKLAQKD